VAAVVVVGCAARIGDHVLAGPHCYLTGRTIGDEVFIATGAMVFNSAQMRTAMRRYARSLSRSHRDDEDTQVPKRQR
jgi:carbonic anhydrase/acetyltransferase-like protein (isoleucine patch superfamily)